MTEIDYLKCKLEDTEKAFDKLHKRHIELLKQQGKLEKENELLKQKLENLGLNEKNDMVEYSIEDFFRWLQRIKKEFEDFEDRGF